MSVLLVETGVPRKKPQTSQVTTYSNDKFLQVPLPTWTRI